MHGDCRDHNMKVVFKVGGGNRPTTGRHGDSWYNFPPPTVPPTPFVPTYSHIGRAIDDIDNEVELPFVALADNKADFGGGHIVGDGPKRGGENIAFASSSRHSVGPTTSDKRGHHEDSHQQQQPHESLVKRLRERMAMEAALRNEADWVGAFHRLVALMPLLVVLLS